MSPGDLEQRRVQVRAERVGTGLVGQAASPVEPALQVAADVRVEHADQLLGRQLRRSARSSGIEAARLFDRLQDLGRVASAHDLVPSSLKGSRAVRGRPGR